MCYAVTPTPRFQSDVKFYKSKRKYTKIISDIDDVINQIKDGKFLGDEIPDLKLPDGMSTYKVRVANSNTNVGKSNGYRLIYYVIKEDRDVFLLTIYYKKDDGRVPTNMQIVDLIKEYCA